MYENQNPLITRAMEFLEIVTRYVILNFIWIVTIMPVAIVLVLIARLFGQEELPWVFIFIPILLVSPATGGLYYATNQLAHDKDGGIAVYWEGLKRYVGPSYRWGILNLLLAFVLSLNIWFYGEAQWAIAPYLRIIFIVSSMFWVTLQLYTFPFLIEQEAPLLKIALKNSFVAVAHYPLRSFGLLILVAVIALASTYFNLILWILVSVSLIAYLSNKNTVVVLEKLLEKEKQLEDEKGES